MEADDLKNNENINIENNFSLSESFLKSALKQPGHSSNIRALNHVHISQLERQVIDDATVSVNSYFASSPQFLASPLSLASSAIAVGSATDEIGIERRIAKTAQEKKLERDKKKEEKLIMKFQREEEAKFHAIAESKCKRYVKYDSKIGEGGYKIVNRGFDKEACRDIAWCEVKKEHLDGREKRQIMIREVEIMLKLDHPNVVKCYDVLKEWWIMHDELSSGGPISAGGSSSGGGGIAGEPRRVEGRGLVFIQELMNEGTLKGMIKKNFHDGLCILETELITRWWYQILDVLRYMHSRMSPPIMHRDVKADNLFLASQPDEEAVSVKIGDFGLATTINKNSQRKTMIGTIGFMAPEVLIEQYDIKVDIYAFGMMMLEVITNKTPYDDCTNIIQVLSKSISKHLPDIISNVSRPLTREVIMACVHPFKLYRPTAEELCEHPMFEKAPAIVTPFLNDLDRSDTIAKFVTDLNTTDEITPVIGLSILISSEFLVAESYSPSVIFEAPPSNSSLPQQFQPPTNSSQVTLFFDVYQTQSMDVEELMDALKECIKESIKVSPKRYNQAEKIFNSIQLQIQYLIKVFIGERWRALFNNFLKKEPKIERLKNEFKQQNLEYDKNKQKKYSNDSQLSSPMKTPPVQVEPETTSSTNNIVEYSRHWSIYNKTTQMLEMEVESYCRRVKKLKRPYFFNIKMVNKPLLYSLQNINPWKKKRKGHDCAGEEEEELVRSVSVTNELPLDGEDHDMATADWILQKDQPHICPSDVKPSPPNMLLEAPNSIGVGAQSSRFGFGQEAELPVLLSVPEMTMVAQSHQQQYQPPQQQQPYPYHRISLSNKNQDQRFHVVKSPTVYSSNVHQRHMSEPSLNQMPNFTYQANSSYPSGVCLTPSGYPIQVPEPPYPHLYPQPQKGINIGLESNQSYLQTYNYQAAIVPGNNIYYQQQQFLNCFPNLLSQSKYIVPQNNPFINSYYCPQLPENHIVQNNMQFTNNVDSNPRYPVAAQQVNTRSLPNTANGTPVMPTDCIAQSSCFHSTSLSSVVNVSSTPIRSNSQMCSQPGCSTTAAVSSDNVTVFQRLSATANANNCQTSFNQKVFTTPVIAGASKTITKTTNNFSNNQNPVKTQEKIVKPKKSKTKLKSRYILKVANIVDNHNGDTLVKFDMLLPPTQMSFTCSLNNEINSINVSNIVKQQVQMPGELARKEILESLVLAVKKICQSLLENRQSVPWNEEYVFHPVYPTLEQMRLCNVEHPSVTSEMFESQWASGGSSLLSTTAAAMGSCASSLSLSRQQSNEDISSLAASATPVSNLELVADVPVPEPLSAAFAAASICQDTRPSVSSCLPGPPPSPASIAQTPGLAPPPFASSNVRVPDFLLSTVRQIVDKLQQPHHCRGLMVLASTSTPPHYKLYDLSGDHVFVGIPTPTGISTGASVMTSTDPSFSVVRCAGDRDFVISQRTVYQNPQYGALLLQPSGELQHLVHPSLVLPSVRPTILSAAPTSGGSAVLAPLPAALQRTQITELPSDINQATDLVNHALHNWNILNHEAAYPVPEEACFEEPVSLEAPKKPPNTPQPQPTNHGDVTSLCTRRGSGESVHQSSAQIPLECVSFEYVMPTPSTGDFIERQQQHRSRKTSIESVVDCVGMTRPRAATALGLRDLSGTGVAPPLVIPTAAATMNMHSQAGPSPQSAPTCPPSQQSQQQQQSMMMQQSHFNPAAVGLGSNPYSLIMSAPGAQNPHNYPLMHNQIMLPGPLLPNQMAHAGPSQHRLPPSHHHPLHHPQMMGHPAVHAHLGQMLMQQPPSGSSGPPSRAPDDAHYLSMMANPDDHSMYMSQAAAVSSYYQTRPQLVPSSGYQPHYEPYIPSVSSVSGLIPSLSGTVVADEHLTDSPETVSEVTPTQPKTDHIVGRFSVRAVNEPGQ